jgi:hypothetical protein
MSNTNTGGPAFPQSYQHTEVAAKMYESGELTAGQLKKAASQLAGMTLRDYFAAKAMQGLMGRSWANTATGKFPENLHDIWATAAYQMADAMLKARDV